MKQQVNPVIGVIIAIVAVVAVGFISMKLFAGSSGVAPSVVPHANNPNDPHFKQDPKLAGGQGQ